MQNIQKLNAITNKKLLLTFITLLVLNSICLIALTKTTGAYNLDGSYSEANSSSLMITALSGLIFSIPLLCAILSLIIAIFVNRTQSYGKRFIKTFLLMLVIIYSIALIRFLMNLFL